MYYDLHLKFKDEAEADAVLFDVGETKRPRYAAIDVIGAIYKPTGKMVKTDEGAVPVMAPIEGWHVNVRHTEEMPELKAWAVTPKTPSHVWA
jgi:hypothetical protein